MASGSNKASEFVPDRLQRIDDHLDRTYIQTGKLPHAQVLIARDDEIVHFSSMGSARQDGGSMVDDSSIFRIASMTKPVTSIGFMILVEEGRVALDTPVGDILPELANIGVYDGGGGDVPFMTKVPAEPLRMIDLLRHTAGFTYGFQNRSNIDAAYRSNKIEEWHGALDLDGFVAELGKLPLEFTPGSSWNYSVSTDVLGAVIQRVSGLPLDKYLDEKIFRPLQMVDTGFVVPEDKRGRLVDCYMWDASANRRVLYDAGNDSLWLRQPKLLSGGGGLVSTALDYHRFCRMCENGGVLEGTRIIGRKTLELMTMNHLPGQADLATLSKSLFSETQNAGAGFGLGFAVTDNLSKLMLPGTVGEYYWGGMFSTYFFIDPVERFHMVFMTQLGPSWTFPIRRELKTLVYAALA